MRSKSLLAVSAIFLLCGFRANMGFWSPNFVIDTSKKSVAAAYSLRKLRVGYTGSAIQVRRSSNNATSNIGFNGTGGLDTAALAAFCGSSSCFVRTWYDQSGNGNNATQTTNSNQPRIVNAGTVETAGSRPTVNFIASSSTYLLLGSYPFAGAGTAEVSVVIYNNSSAGWSRIFDFGASTSVNFFATHRSGSNDFRFRITTSGGGGEQGPTGGTTLNSTAIHGVTFRHSGTAMTVWVNGTQLMTAAGVSVLPSATSGGTNYIGRSHYPDPYLNAKISEFIIYDEALLDSERRVVERSQQQFYGFTGL